MLSVYGLHCECDSCISKGKTHIRYVGFTTVLYMLLALVTGVFLLVLCVEMIVKYVLRAPDDLMAWIAWIPFAHGWVYVVYLVTVVDLWVDRSEAIFRHLEVAVPVDGGGTRSVLLPINFCRITRRGVRVGALLASQFATVPGTRDPQSVTMLEEEKIMATWGAGLLYATPERAEPLF